MLIVEAVDVPLAELRVDSKLDERIPLSPRKRGREILRYVFRYGETLHEFRHVYVYVGTSLLFSCTHA